MINTENFKKEKGQTSASLITAIIIAFAIGALGGYFFGNYKSSYKASQQTSTVSQQSIPSVKVQALRADMRKLWTDHIFWTRLFIVSADNDTKDIKNITQRLLKNQEDIGNAIKLYYGEDAGNQLTQLLKTHITTAADLVKAAKKGDKSAETSANDKWYANANVIADFLSKSNPNWPNDQAKAMMKEHLDLTKQEAVDILSDKYDEAIADFDKVSEQILNMADMLTDGIVKQFPDKF